MSSQTISARTAAAVQAQPQRADAQQHRLDSAAQRPELTCQKIGLLGAHALRARPAQAEQERRQARFGHELLEQLAHGHGRVKHRPVRADDLDGYVAHGHKVAHDAALAIAHGLAPLGGDGPGPLGGGTALHPVAARPADDGIAHIARALPVFSDRAVNFQQDVREERHTAQQRDAIGAARLRVQRREQQQLLPRQRPHPAVRIAAAQHDLEGRLSLPDFQRVHIAPAHSPQVALRHEHLADGPAVGQKAVEIGREEAVDAGLPAPARNGPQEFIQRGLLLGASHREAAAQPHKLADGRIQHGKRLPHGAVELRLAGRDGRKARAERALHPAAQLRRRRRDALLFSKHVFPPLLGETLNSIICGGCRIFFGNPSV